MSPGRVIPPRMRELGRAQRLGSLVLLGVAVMGQLIALGVFIARGADGSVLEHLGIGWLYFAGFHGAPLEVDPATAGVVVSTSVTVALLLPTLAAAWLSFAAGRTAARDAVGPVPWRIAVGASIAVPYAVASFLVSLAVIVHLELVVTDNLFGGPVDVTVDPVALLVRTFAIALVPAVTGALAAVRGPDLHAVGRLHAAIAGGARAFGLALLFAFVGLLVNAGADPSAARGYFELISEPSPTATAIIVGHHVLVLPNQSLWVLVPAMGGADELRFAETEQTIVSYGASVREIGVGVPTGGAGAPAVTTQPLPRWYLLFLLVPGLATFLGGARAAEISGSLRGALALGASAGLVFGGLVVAGAALSTLAWRVTLAAGEGPSVTAGPDLGQAAVLGLAWGIVGGLVGAWWRSSVRSSRPRGSPER